MRKLSYLFMILSVLCFALPAMAQGGEASAVNWVAITSGFAMTPPLGLSSSQLQLAAATARFHRGALPTLRHRVLREFALDQKKIALHLAGILRLAHALVGGSEGGVLRVSVETDGKGVMILAQGYNPWTPAAEKIAGAAYLLELVLRRPFLIKAAPRPRPRKTPGATQARRT